MRFIITGTPRSATKYGARLITEAGVPCSHERVLRPLTPVIDVLRWLDDDTPGESSWMAWTLLPLLPEPIPVLHTIRDPWAVIDSLANRNSILKVDQARTPIMLAIRDTVQAYLPDVFSHDSLIDRAASLVVGWNRLIARAAPERFVYYPDRLDVKTLGKMMIYIGAGRVKDNLDRVLATVSTSTNQGYTVDDAPGVSDPIVAKFIEQYAKENNIGTIFNRVVGGTPERLMPMELAEAMSPTLLERVNVFAESHGFQTVDAPMAVVA